VNRRDVIRELVAESIPIILLAIYVFAIGAAIQSTFLAVDLCNNNVACAQAFHARRIEGVNVILNVVGGLVSALVVTELAITQPGQLPSAQILKTRVSRSAKKVMVIVSMGFILVWLAGGAVSLIVYILYPAMIPAALSEFAKAWLGLAIASAYSYLGIR
jgi:hypothetical protein